MTQQLLLESSLLLAVIGAYEWRLRIIANKISKVPCRDEVERLVDLKLEVVKSGYDHLREDIQELREDTHMLRKDIQELREGNHSIEHKLDLLIAKELKT